MSDHNKTALELGLQSGCGDIMTKKIEVRLSDDEYREIQQYVVEGKARTAADFAHTGTIYRLERMRERNA